MSKFKNSCSRIRQRLTLQQEIRTGDSAGGYVRSWQNVADIWAEITPLTGKEKLFSERLQGSITHRILIRFRSDITTENRLFFENRVFNIRSVSNVKELGDTMEILAEEGVEG